MIWLLVGLALGFSLGFVIQCVKVAKYRDLARADRAHLEEMRKCFTLLLDKSLKDTTHDYNT